MQKQHNNKFQQMKIKCELGYLKTTLQGSNTLSEFEKHKFKKRVRYLQKKLEK